ncbi:hypothetical protein [Methylobacterium sp. A54F]
MIIGIDLILAVICAYLFALTVFALPSFVAFRRRDPNRWLILAFNSSIVGWVVALALAVYPLFRSGQPSSAGGRHGADASEEQGQWLG